MNRSVCIVGAGDFNESLFSPPEDAFIIAADAGYTHLKKAGKTPDLVLGDFDSLGGIPDLPGTLVYPSVKDDSDLGIAAKLSLDKGYNRFYIYGATGGSRPEHTVANLQTLCMLSRNGAKAFIVAEEGTVYTAVTNGEIAFLKETEGFFSVFCIGKEATGITIEGARYPLQDATLSPFEPLGVSNEFTGVSARIKVQNGTLLIVWRGKPSDLTE